MDQLTSRRSIYATKKKFTKQNFLAKMAVVVTGSHSKL